MPVETNLTRSLQEHLAHNGISCTCSREHKGRMSHGEESHSHQHQSSCAVPAAHADWSKACGKIFERIRPLFPAMVLSSDGNWFDMPNLPRLPS